MNWTRCICLQDRIGTFTTGNRGQTSWAVNTIHTLYVTEGLQMNFALVWFLESFISRYKPEGGGKTLQSCLRTAIKQRMKKRRRLPTILCFFPVPAFRSLRWRTGGEGGGARRRTARMTTSPALVPTAGGLAHRRPKAEEEIQTHRRRQWPGMRPRATSSPSVWVAVRMLAHRAGCSVSRPGPGTFRLWTIFFPKCHVFAFVVSHYATRLSEHLTFSRIYFDQKHVDLPSVAVVPQVSLLPVS